ncbi:MAG: DUF3783 domain-containing protein [Lachnospiraceae bacterium]|nr:DUF3783 domain-containing protein [Lachnospiraceae bacterium]
MRKSVLLCGFPEAELRELRAVCALQGCRCIPVPFGHGALTVLQALSGETLAGDPSEEEVSRLLVMAGFTRGDLDSFLLALRRGSLSPIPYKAMLTETNKDWPLAQLYREIMREHEAMQRQKPDRA